MFPKTLSEIWQYSYLKRYIYRQHHRMSFVKASWNLHVHCTCLLPLLFNSSQHYKRLMIFFKSLELIHRVKKWACWPFPHAKQNVKERPPRRVKLHYPCPTNHISWNLVVQLGSSQNRAPSTKSEIGSGLDFEVCMEFTSRLG